MKYAVLASLVALAARPTLAQDPAPAPDPQAAILDRLVGTPRTVSVSGTFTSHVVPDLVNWHLHIKEWNTDLAAAKQVTDQHVQSILALGQELNVDAPDIQTGNMEIERIYERDHQGNRGDFKYFEVRRSITIKQRDLARFDEFLSRFVDAQAELNFSFGVSNEEEVRWQTRLKAVETAKEKATAMAEAAGAQVGQVITLSEFSPAMPGPYMWMPGISNVSMPYGAVGGLGGGGYGGGMSSAPDAAQGTLAPGSIPIAVTVYATFELE